MKKLKSFFAFCMAVCLTMGICLENISPVVTYAANPTKAYGSVSWEYNEATKTLTISGSGSVISDQDSSDGDLFFDEYDFGKKMTKVVFSEGITDIHNMYFNNCTALQSVSFPASLKHVYTSFRDTNLSSVTFASGSQLETITATFDYCTNLKSITLPKGLKTIEDAAFENSGLTSITIPASVTTIDNYSFYECSSLQKVEFASGSKLKEIGDKAFYGCEALTSLSLPASVETIGDSAFEYCNNLTSATVYASNSIGECAFNDCSKLKTVDIKSAGIIKNRAFNETPALTSIVFPGDISSIEDYLFAYFDEDVTNLNSITFTGTAPESIGKNAFYHVTAEVEIPSEDASWTAKNKLNYGGNLTWKGGENQEDEVTDSGTCGSNVVWEFYSATGLLNINIDPEATGDGRIDDFAYYDQPWAEYMNEFKKVVIGTGVTYIGSRSFDEAENLEEVTIPDTVTGMGEGAFYGTGVKKVSLPDSITEIGTGAFMDCMELTEINVPNSLKIIPEQFMANDNKVQSIVIPEGVTFIENEAFFNCNSLTGLNIPASVTTIGTRAFARGNGGVDPNELNNSHLEKITFADNSELTSIESEAFRNNVKLRTVNFPKKLLSIGENAFNGCESLEEVVLPNSLTSIGDGAFGDNAKLSKLKFGSGLKTIGMYAFLNCVSLSEVVIPENVDIVDDDSFYGCENLTSVEFKGDNTKLGVRVFCKCVNLSTVNIPKNITVLGEKVFNGCSITEIIIPNKVTRIEEAAFSGNKIKEINIPDSVEYIGEQAFDCDTLQKVNFGSNSHLQEICAFAFGAKSNIDQIIIPASVKYLGVNAFGKMTGKWNSIVFLGDAPDINEWAFSDVTTTVFYPAGNKTWDEIVAHADEKYHYADLNWEPYTDVNKLEHKYGVPTFTWTGFTSAKATFICSNGTNHKEVIDATISMKTIKAATVELEGTKTYTATVVLDGKIYTDTKTVTVPKLKADVHPTGSHDLSNNITKATLTKDGKIEKTCKLCGEITDITIISHPEKITLSETSFKYDGTVKKPTVKVVDSIGNIISSSNYTVSYENASGTTVNPVDKGTYKVKVVFKGNYSGTKYISFTIEDEAGKWIKSNGKWWYRHADGTYTKNGWEKIDGKWYHFDASGYMQTGWQKLSNKWYYFDASGVMLTGWQKLSEKWYYFDASGVMLTGWQKLSNKWYYFDASGVMLTGWQKLSNKWYYFDASGVMVTGWQKLSNKWYYFDASGVMLTGWQEINSKWYYFDASGVMQSACWVNKIYYMDSTGVMVTSAYIKDGSKYYWMDKNGKYTKTYSEKDTKGYTIYDQATGKKIS